MPERGSGAGWDIRHLFSPPSRAAEGREDPHTEPHAPAHGAPGNPTPITMEDMSDQEGVGSASDPEATLTHPSARDTRRVKSVLYRFVFEERAGAHRFAVWKVTFMRLRERSGATLSEPPPPKTEAV